MEKQILIRLVEEDLKSPISSALSTLARLFTREDYKVVFMAAVHPPDYKEVIQNWLLRQGVPFDSLELLPDLGGAIDHSLDPSAMVNQITALANALGPDVIALVIERELEMAAIWLAKDITCLIKP